MQEIKLNSKNGICLICEKEAQIKTVWWNGRTDERIVSHFDLCESCKQVRNCFTCRFSKVWYLRYKGKCDVNFELLQISLIFDGEITEAKKKALREVIKKFEIQIKPGMMSNELLEIIKPKLENKISEYPDCWIYKTRKIGQTIQDFWKATPCKRYSKGDCSKKEFDDYQASLYDYNEEDLY